MRQEVLFYYHYYYYYQCYDYNHYYYTSVSLHKQLETIFIRQE